MMLTDACDLGVRTVTASQVQYIVKLFVVPATIQRQAPTIKTVQGAVDVLSVPVSRSSGSPPRVEDVGEVLPSTVSLLGSNTEH